MFNAHRYVLRMYMFRRERGDIDSALESDAMDDAAAPNTNYSLFAVVNHHGSLHSGHYTSFVQHTDQVKLRLQKLKWLTLSKKRANLLFSL